MGLLEDAGAWAGIIGAFLGAVAIWITVQVFFKVQEIDNTRRNDQKKHFKKLIVNNINDVLRLYDTITILSSRKTHTPEELDERTKELDIFFHKNKELILNLIRDTKFYASMLGVIDSPEIDMDSLVNRIRWLIDEYYIIEQSIERNKRRWIGLEQELQNNKDFIEKTLSSLQTL